MFYSCEAAARFRAKLDGPIVSQHKEEVLNLQNAILSAEHSGVVRSKGCPGICTIVTWQMSQSALMTLGYFSKQEHEKERVIPILIQVCNSTNIAHVQSAVMSLAEIDSTEVDQCFESMINNDSTDVLIKEILEASMSRRQSLFGN